MCLTLCILSLFPIGFEGPTSGASPLAFLGQDGIAKTGQFIASHRAETGGYCTQKGSNPSLRATFQARKALKTLGIAPVKPELDVKFAKECIEEDTHLFLDRPGEKPSALFSAAGIMTFVALGIHESPDLQPAIEANKRYLQVQAKSFEEIRLGAAAFEALGHAPPVRREWIHQLRKNQSAEGGFGPLNSRLKDTGGVVAGLLRLGEGFSDKDKQVYLEYLLEGQGQAGGFGMTSESASDLDSSYRVGRAIWMLGGSPDQVKMKMFLKKCQTANGGFADRPGEEGTLADTYRAVMIASWLKGNR